MNAHVDDVRFAAELVATARMLDKAAESLLTRPLSTTDVAWAKGCLERGVSSLDSILANTYGTPTAA